MGTAALSTTGAFRVIYSKGDQELTLESACETLGINPSEVIKTNRFFKFLIHSFEARASRNTNYHLFVF
jgi:hypothetical protein